MEYVVYWKGYAICKLHKLQQTNEYLSILTFKYVVLLAYENLLLAILVNIWEKSIKIETIMEIKWELFSVFKRLWQNLI